MAAKHRARTDLGLELLCRRATYGQPLTAEDVAIWCGTTRQNIHYLEQRALRKLRNHDSHLADRLRSALR